MSSSQNDLFYSMINEALTSDQNNKWVFKTSYVYAIGNQTALDQPSVLAPDLVPSIQEFITEAKPYHTKFTGLNDRRVSNEDTANVIATDSHVMKLKLIYDRVSDTIDLDYPVYDFDPYDSLPYETSSKRLIDAIESLGLSYAAERVYKILLSSKKYADRTDLNVRQLLNLVSKEASRILGSSPKGYYLRGPNFKDQTGYDNSEFDGNTGFDTPTVELTYLVTNTPTQNDLDHGYIIVPPATVTFNKPIVPFMSYLTKVYKQVGNGNIEFVEGVDYTNTDNSITFDVAPVNGSKIKITVTDHNYVYDRIIQTEDSFLPVPSDADIIIEGPSLKNKYFFNRRPEEAVVVRSTEGISINVYTETLIQGYQPGYDASPYDSLPYDLGTGEVSEISGGGPQLHYIGLKTEDFETDVELDHYPMSDDAVFVTVNGLFKRIYVDFRILWDDPETDVGATLPRVKFLTALPANALVEIRYVGFGGTGIRDIFRLQKYSSQYYTLPYDITSNNLLYVTVDGIPANTALIGTNQVYIMNPIPGNSFVSIAVFTTNDFSKVVSQNTTGGILNSPPGSTTPGYNSIFVQSLVSNKRVSPPYTKIYQTSGIGPYSTYAPSGSTYQVYLGATLLTLGVDYIVTVGSPYDSITLNSVPPLNTELFIYSLDGTEGFTLVSNFTTIVGLANNSRVTTFNEDISLGLRTENFAGTNTNSYPLAVIPRNDIKSSVLVFVNGIAKEPEADFYVDGSNLIFRNQSDFTGSKILVHYEIENQTQYPLAFKMYYDAFSSKWKWLRMAERYSTKIAKPVSNKVGINTYDKIWLDDISILMLPTPNQNNPSARVPGVIWVNNERIEFWEYDHSDNTISYIIRGTLNTPIAMVHEVGDEVLDGSKLQNIPVELDDTKNVPVYYYYVTEQQEAFRCPGIIDNNDVQVWSNSFTEIIADVTTTSTQIAVKDASKLQLPGSSKLRTVRDSVTFSFGEQVKIKVNDVEKIFNCDGVYLNLVANVQADTQLYGLGLRVTIDEDDYVIFENISGGALEISNVTGTPTETMFDTNPAIAPKSSVKGAIWIDAEKIEFERVDFSLANADLLLDLTRPYPANHSVGTRITNSKWDKLSLGNDYKISGEYVVMNTAPTIGKYIRIQPSSKVGKFTIPKMILEDESSIGRFLRKAPYRRKDV